MKKNIYSFVLLLYSIITCAQVGLGSLSPYSSSIFEVTNKDLLKLTPTALYRVALTIPTADLEVFDTTTNTSWYCNEIVWINQNHYLHFIFRAY